MSPTTRRLGIADPRRLLQRPTIYKAFLDLVGSHAATLRFSTDFVRAKSGDRILDVGCGPGRLIPYLPRVDYCGIDLDPRYLAHARALYGASGARFHLRDLTADSSDFPERDFEIVVAFGLLHHLDDAGAARLIDLCHERLRPGGRLVTIDSVIDSRQSRAARFLVSLDRGGHVRTAPAYEELAGRRFGSVTTTILHDLLRIPYTHVILDCTK